MKEAIDCTVDKDNSNNKNGNQTSNQNCDKNNKYENGKNEIEQYFRGVAGDNLIKIQMKRFTSVLKINF
nr:Mlp family lipoprotein [Borreliella bavariensis]